MPSEPLQAPSRRPSRASLADSVYDILLGQLMDGQIGPEAPLNIDALSRTLMVSQTPIREALARLEATGLITRAALRGYRVAPLFTDRELADLMDARAVIEPANAERAARTMTAEGFGELEQSIEDLRRSPRGPTFTEIRQYWSADERFHDVIARYADNAFLLAAYQSLGGHVQRFRLFGGLGVTDADAAIAEHGTILVALHSGDPAEAGAAMRTHILRVKSRARTDLAAHE